MKSITKFVPITKKQIKELSTELKGILSEYDLNFFSRIDPYKSFGKDQLDTIFLIAQVTIEGNGQVQNLSPVCTINQENWDNKGEADIRIDSINIPLQILIPKTPLEISGSKTFLAVLMTEGNIWDYCKDLPDWLWNERKFEFMLSFVLTTEDGKKYFNNDAGQYASELIDWQENDDDNDY